MRTQMTTIFIALALGMASLVAVPAGAQEAPTVPETPNIVDPLEDANFVNDGTQAGLGKNHTGPADASTVADLVAVWFSNTADTVSIHFQTQAAPPASNGITYQLFATPGEGDAGSSEQGCLRALGNIPGSLPGGGTYQAEPFIRLVDRCNVGTSIFDDSVEGQFKIEEGPEGTGITTFTFPRAYSPLLSSGASLKAPQARSSSPTVGEHTNVGFASPSTDDTEIGTDYALVEGEATAKEPTKQTPPGKKKGAGKGKGKKRGHASKGKKAPKPGKPAAACSPFAPGEAGADKPIVVVSDTATEEKPVEQTVTLDASIADLTFGLTDAGRDAFNIQVDSAAKDAGLYAYIEFPARNDLDLNLLHPDGSYGARSRSWNTIQETTDQGPVTVSTQGHGGEGTDHSEKLVGIRTADCGGWTLSVENWLGFGGEFSVKLWLGEAKTDPQAPGEET